MSELQLHESSGTTVRLSAGPLRTALAAATLVWASTLGAAAVDVSVEQRITADPPVQGVTAGGTATVTFVYDATDATLPGVALRVHYDSTQIQLDEAQLLFSPGIMGHQDQADAGSDYADKYDDGNPATDRRYLAAWSDIAGGWPGENVARPLPLLRLRFKVNGTFSSTDLALTGSACGGCRLDLQSARIELVGGGLTPALPSPTTTPTPGPDLDSPIGDAPPGPLGGGSVPVQGIPTLSSLGAVLLSAALAASAVALLLRRRG